MMQRLDAKIEEAEAGGGACPLLPGSTVTYKVE